MDLGLEPDLDLAIRGALVATGQGTCRADIGIKDGRIAALAEEVRSKREIDARGLLALPGLIDPHVHLEDVGTGGVPTADDFASGTASAVSGGVTTILDFVSPDPGQDFLDAFRARRDQAARGSRVDFGLHCCLPAGGGDPTGAIDALVREGVTSFKAFTVYQGLALNEFELFRAMRAVATHGNRGALLMLHAEEGAIVDGLVAEFLSRGDKAAIFHAYSRPAVCEEAAVARALALRATVGAALYLVHLSTGAAVSLAAARHRTGEKVYLETCPQYLMLSEDRLSGPGGERFVCSPPLRPRAENEVLWAALARGDIDCIGTDHCPFRAGDRLRRPSFADIPNGLGGIGFALELLYTYGVRTGRIDLDRLVGLTSGNAARVFGLWPWKGQIAPGADADVVLFDPDARHRIDAADLPGGEDYTVYQGMESQGRVMYTISRGQVVFDRISGSGVIGDPGRGRFIARPYEQWRSVA